MFSSVIPVSAPMSSGNLRGGRKEDCQAGIINITTQVHTTHRQTDRHTDTQTHRHTDTHRHTQTHRHIDTHTDTHTHTDTDTHHTQADR